MESALGGPSDVETGGDRPEYVAFRDAARGEMAAIRAQMTELKGFHGRAALSRFDESHDDEIQVEVSTQQITKLFRRCEARLLQFGAASSPSEADEKVFSILLCGAHIVLAFSLSCGNVRESSCHQRFS